MSTSDYYFRNAAHASPSCISRGFMSLPKFVIVSQRSGAWRDPPGSNRHERLHFGVIARAAIQPLLKDGTPRGRSARGLHRAWDWSPTPGKTAGLVFISLGTGV